MIERFKLGALRALVFLRLIDVHDNNLSITNIALIISLFKLATAPQTNITDVGAVMVSLSSYGYKKFLYKDIINKSQTRNEG